MLFAVRSCCGDGCHCSRSGKVPDHVGSNTNPKIDVAMRNTFWSLCFFTVKGSSNCYSPLPTHQFLLLHFCHLLPFHCPAWACLSLTECLRAYVWADLPTQTSFLFAEHIFQTLFFSLPSSYLVAAHFRPLLSSFVLIFQPVPCALRCSSFYYLHNLH